VITVSPEREVTVASPYVPEAASEARMDIERGDATPLLSLVVATGLLLVAIADAFARTGASWTQMLFWTGMLVLFVPAAIRVASPRASQRERVCLLAILGLGLYLVKVLRSPILYTFFDEMLHWRGANDLLQSGHLFAENPLLPVSPLYPGLESATTAVAAMSGLSVFHAGIVVVATARLLMVLALFALYSEVSRSTRVAALATVLYMTNPHFLFFDAQFAYESLALPIATLTIFATVRRSRAQGGAAVAWTLVIVVGLAATVVTHHVTSFILAAFLTCWTVGSLLARRLIPGHTGEPHPGGIPLLAALAAVTWMTFVASPVVPYLASPVLSAANKLRYLLGDAATRGQALAASGGPTLPVAERLAGYAAVASIFVLLPIGAFIVWRHYRNHTFALVLAGLALTYPASIALRFTQDIGAEVSDRASAFLFVAVGFLLAIVVSRFWIVNRDWKRASIVGAWTAIVLSGGIIIGEGPNERLPGPYLVGADSRSIDQEGISAATWANYFLGPNNRIATDRTNRLLMGSYGEQRPVTGYFDNVSVADLFFARSIGTYERGILQRGGIAYVVVDRRLSTALPLVGVYFEEGERDGSQALGPIDAAALTKFDQLQDASRQFDSGDIVIYAVRSTDQ